MYLTKGSAIETFNRYSQVATSIAYIIIYLLGTRDIES